MFPWERPELAGKQEDEGRSSSTQTGTFAVGRALRLQYADTTLQRKNIKAIF